MPFHSTLPLREQSVFQSKESFACVTKNRYQNLSLDLLIIQQVLLPQIDLLTEQQMLQVCNLRHLSQQAEEALSKGLEKLQQNLVQEVADNQLGAGHYASEVAAAMEKLEALEDFVNQVISTYQTCAAPGRILDLLH